MSGSPFPSPGQFVGSFVPREAATIEGGQSTYEGSIAVTPFDRAVVQQALPAQFQLADRSDGATTHPVIHMVGHQRSPMLINQGEVKPAPDPGYQEMILLIPYVVRMARTLWHTFVVRMFLNDEAAIFIGNNYYAYRKAFAALPETLPADAIETRVLPFLEGDVFKSSVTRTAPWSSCGAGTPTVPGFADIQTLFAMPFLGVDDAGAGAPAVCSYWEWEYGCAEVAPAGSQHDFIKQCAPGMAHWLGPATSPAGGAMLIRDLRWRIPLPPHQCLF